jgi:hypothetical protein
MSMSMRARARARPQVPARPFRIGARRAAVLAAASPAIGILVAAVPSECLAFIGAVYASAVVLTLAGLFNWALWLWLVEVTAYVHLFLHPEHPWHSVPGLIFLLWSGLVFFWVGSTFLLRRFVGEPVAMAVSLALALVQIGAVYPLSMWLQDLCDVGIHACGCGR